MSETPRESAPITKPGTDHPSSDWEKRLANELATPIVKIRLPLGFLAFLYGAVVVYLFSSGYFSRNQATLWPVVHLLLWTLVPPLFFYVEWVCLAALSTTDERD
jgi:hypothetical protein